MKNRILLAIAVVAIIVASALIRNFVLAPQKTTDESTPVILQTLRNARELTLYSLDPENLLLKPQAERPAASEIFHNFRILSQTSLSGSGRDRAVSALDDAIFNWDGTEFKCFEPRHGIRVTVGDASYDLVICFKCKSLEMYSPDGKTITHGLNDAAKPLNALLTADNVPLPTN